MYKCERWPMITGMKTMRWQAYFRGVALAMLCLLIHTGCRSLDYDEQSPISPLSGCAYPLSGFAAEESASQDFEWQVRGECLCLSIPTPGDYLLTYTETERDGAGLFSTFAADAESASPSAIAFHAYAPVRLYIRLDSTPLNQLRLRQGTIADDAVGLYDDGPVIRFATPSIPTIFWSDVFSLDLTAPPILLKQRESACPQDSVRSPY